MPKLHETALGVLAAVNDGRLASVEVGSYFFHIGLWSVVPVGVFGRRGLLDAVINPKILEGLGRRTGKSTMFFQLMNSIEEETIKETRALLHHYSTRHTGLMLNYDTGPLKDHQVSFLHKYLR